jgi:hypothetical protein
MNLSPTSFLSLAVEHTVEDKSHFRDPVFGGARCVGLSVLDPSSVVQVFEAAITLNTKCAANPLPTPTSSVTFQFRNDLIQKG